MLAPYFVEALNGNLLSFERSARERMEEQNSLFMMYFRSLNESEILQRQ
jgi:hypothetical protein